LLTIINKTHTPKNSVSFLISPTSASVVLGIRDISSWMHYGIHGVANLYA